MAQVMSAIDPNSPESLVQSPGELFLTHEFLSELVAVEHWAPLEPQLHKLTEAVETSASVGYRTTLLTWLYAEQGVMAYREISQRIVGSNTEETYRSRRDLRNKLAKMQSLLLVSIVHFPGDDQDEGNQDEPRVVGKNSMVSLTWAGMVWLRRAWAARARLAGPRRSIAQVHRDMCEEEDVGRALEAFWVDNITTVSSEGPSERAKRIRACKGVASVFDLARKKR